MRGRIIRVGNSRGGDGNALVIRPRHRPREGWGEAFAQMAARVDDKLLDLGRSPGTRWDTEEWEWR